MFIQHRYRNSMFWTDGTVAHFKNIKSEFNMKTTETCMRLRIFVTKSVLDSPFTTECDLTDTITHHLCQMSDAATNPQPPEIPTTIPSSTLSKVVYKQYLLLIICC